MTWTRLEWRKWGSKQISLLSLACVFSTNAAAMPMQELFDAVNAQGNVNNPAVLQAQTMNLYTGGSLFMRMPKRTYPLAYLTPPSWNAGCGGINLFNEHRMVLMSMIGSTIFLTDAPNAPLSLPRKEITVERLVGARSTSDTITLPIWLRRSLYPAGGRRSARGYRPLFGGYGGDANSQAG